MNIICNFIGHSDLCNKCSCSIPHKKPCKSSNCKVLDKECEEILEDSVLKNDFEEEEDLFDYREEFNLD